MNVFLKSLVYLVAFSTLHFGYDATHWVFLTPFCGVSESVFEHLKLAFWAYLVASVIEYFVVRRDLAKREGFWYPRFFSAIVVPWFIVLVWYLVPALFGKIQPLILELLWSIFSAYVAGIMGGITEGNIEGRGVSRSFKVLVVVLLIISSFFYVWFTYNSPWIDVFVNPETL